MTSAFTFTSWAFWAAFASVLLMLSGWKRLMPERWHRPELRQGLLLAFSLGFYALVGGQLVGLLVGSILVNHLLTQAMWSQRGTLRHLLLGAGIAFHLGVLGVFKYAYFVADLFPGSPLQGTLHAWRLDQWMLPVGISFYTFQAISYIVDVHRGTLARPASLLSLATYITFFPQLVAGPIVRAKQFLPQLQANLWTSHREDDARHVRLILGGFLKKLVLGDLVGAWLVDPVFERPAEWVSWEVMLALYGYSLQVYADFSGYTDMAKGMAGLLGITLPENFRFPYRATSPSDFWRRWHITLSQWWKDYVYIPLGGNRRFSALSVLWVASMLVSGMVLWGELGGVLLLAGGTLLAVAGILMAPRVHAKLATAANVMIVMLLGGLWHGAHLNFVTWGALNGAVLVLWIVWPLRVQASWAKLLGWLITFHTVVLARIWFRAGSLIAWNESTDAPHPENAWETAQVLWKQLGQAAPNPIDQVWSPTYAGGIALLALGYALHLMPERARNWMEQQTTSKPLWLTWLLWCIATMLALWCSASYPKPFIYWQF